MSKLSVIVPVYKAEKYIHKCIDSIVNQSFNDWELIIIDDGSPDNSGSICDEYAKKDKRIRIIHKNNEGVSVARNIGIENSTGEYITFIDSDDHLEGNCFFLVENAVSDLLVFESISYDSNKNIKKWYDINDDHISDNTRKKDFIEKYISLFVLDGPCAKFFRRDAIGNIRFPEGQSLGEDNVFMLSFINRCKSIELRKGAYYVIDDHYCNGSKKYIMPANKSLLCLTNILNAYNSLNIYIPSFERRMFHTFFMVIDPKSDYDCWYTSCIVKDLERKYLRLESISYRIFYYAEQYNIIKKFAYFCFWKYVKIRQVLS